MRTYMYNVSVAAKVEDQVTHLQSLLWSFCSAALEGSPQCPACSSPTVIPSTARRESSGCPLPVP